MSFSSSFVQVNVGGIPYSIAVNDIEKFPGSFFACMIKKEWKHNSAETISIQRDGALFKLVYAYLVNGHLPRDEEGLIDLDDATLDGLKEEADFYGLVGLCKECSVQRRSDLQSYLTLRKYISSLHRHGGNLRVDVSSQLVRALKCIWAPFCVSGLLGTHPCFHKTFYGKSSSFAINLEELIAVATQSSFGRGTDTVVDTSVRNSFEIDASLFDTAVLNEIGERTDYRSLAPHLELTLRPYKLVIYKEGGHFDFHRDTVRGEGHIGTLVKILNSKFTGGELVVTHGGRTEKVRKQCSWTAMYGDCLHKINPITSGTRVSLIYDIYGKGLSMEDLSRAYDERHQDRKEDNSDSEYEEERESDRYWGHQPKGSHERKEASAERGPVEADIAFIYEHLDAELENYDTIIICLQHLYPECQTNPAFLKGGDRVLYDILTRNSRDYEVQVVAATIYRSDYHYEFPSESCGALFSPTIVKQRLRLMNSDPDSDSNSHSHSESDSDSDSDSDSESESESESDSESDSGSDSDRDEEKETEVPLKKQKLNPTAALGLTKLVLFSDLESDSLLDYTPYNEHTGNEPQAEESVYIVAGLQVRSKE